MKSIFRAKTSSRAEELEKARAKWVDAQGELNKLSHLWDKAEQGSDWGECAKLRRLFEQAQVRERAAYETYRTVALASKRAAELARLIWGESI